MKLKKPAPLQPGDTLAVVAPSTHLDGEDLEKGLAWLQTLGYQVRLGRSVTASWGYLAGTDELRAADLNAAFADDEVRAILCLRGGYGAARLLPLLDYEMIASKPKLFIGFSDITALHIALQQRSGLVTVHAPMLATLGGQAAAYTLAQFAAGLAVPVHAGPLPLPPDWQLETLVPGTVSGPLCGGNMMLISSLTGTPYALDGQGGILFLEEVGEEAYSLDRMLCQFEQSGLISRIKGLAFGEFSRCRPEEQAEGEWTVREIVTYYARRWGKPAVWGLPCGHGRYNGWLPLGVSARLAADYTAAQVIVGEE